MVTESLSILLPNQPAAANGAVNAAAILDANAKEALRLVFAPKGSYAAELLAEVCSSSASLALLQRTWSSPGLPSDVPGAG